MGVLDSSHIVGVLGSSALRLLDRYPLFVAQHLILSFASHIPKKRPALISVNPSTQLHSWTFLFSLCPRLVSTVVTMHNPLTEQTFLFCCLYWKFLLALFDSFLFFSEIDLALGSLSCSFFYMLSTFPLLAALLCPYVTRFISFRLNSVSIYCARNWGQSGSAFVVHL